MESAQWDDSAHTPQQGYPFHGEIPGTQSCLKVEKTDCNSKESSGFFVNNPIKRIRMGTLGGTSPLNCKEVAVKCSASALSQQQLIIAWTFSGCHMDGTGSHLL